MLLVGINLYRLQLKRPITGVSITLHRPMLRRYGVLIPTPTMSVMRGCSIVQLVLFYKYSQHQLVENADSEATVDAGTAKISTRRSSVLVSLHDVVYTHNL